MGGYVDKTKQYKDVTLACLSATLGLLVVLGLAFGFDLDMPHYVVIMALLGLGATAGPVQPINAELAVEVSSPADETNIEAVQQLCGNLFSALLVPLCEKAANMDFEIPTVLRVSPRPEVRTYACVCAMASSQPTTEATMGRLSFLSLRIGPRWPCEVAGVIQYVPSNPHSPLRHVPVHVFELNTHSRPIHPFIHPSIHPSTNH